MDTDTSTWPDVPDELPWAAPDELAGAVLRALRAHAGLSQRELAAKAGMSPSTVARAEAGGKTPSWTSMVRAVRAGGCQLWLLTRDGIPVPPREFDDVRDQGDRHLPAHLEAWCVEHASQWWGYRHFGTWFPNEPAPSHTYRRRPRWEE